MLEGPDAGRKKRFKSVRMVVGRGKDVDLKLTDQAVSRRHLELIHGDSGTLMRDLGGASGTKVNDERVEEKLLKHGDEIAIGRTLLRFVDEMEAVKQFRAEQDAKEAAAKKKAEEEAKKKEEEAAKKKEAAANAAAAGQGGGGSERSPPQGGHGRSAPRRTRCPPAGARARSATRRSSTRAAPACSLVVLLVVLIIIFAKKDPPAPPPPDPKEQLATAKMNAARNAIRDGQYPEAVKLIEDAERLKPGIDEEGLAKTAQAEAAVMEAFTAVRALMAEGNFEEARRKLEAAPAGTTAKSDEERAALDKEITQAEAAFFARRAEELLAAGRPGRAARDHPEAAHGSPAALPRQGGGAAGGPRQERRRAGQAGEEQQGPGGQAGGGAARPVHRGRLRQRGAQVRERRLRARRARVRSRHRGQQGR